MAGLNSLFAESVGWRVLAHFMAHPLSSFHIRELSRALGVSPASASRAVKALEGDGLLVKEERGLAHIFSLNADNPTLSALRKGFGIYLVLSARPAEAFLRADPRMISLALFGSFADGSFDERSDVDFLVVTPAGKGPAAGAARELEGRLGKRVSLSVFKLSEWRRAARRCDAFYKRVVENHVLLHGSGLR